MKTTIGLALAFSVNAASATASEKAALTNLVDLGQLNNGDNAVLSPLESMKHVYTFEEVPIFGGAELRDEMRSQGGKSQKKGFLGNVGSFFSVTADFIGCGAHTVGRATVNLFRNEPLGYSSYCETIPTNRAARSAAVTEN